LSKDGETVFLLLLDDDFATASKTDLAKISNQFGFELDLVLLAMLIGIGVSCR